MTANAVFEPECTAGPSYGYGDPTTVADLRDPFYASTSPQMYAISSATIVSYLLVIILFITPRTFFVGGPGGGASFLGRRGMISGSYGSSSVVGVGGRPWLQKVAALTVAISLTMATADTFNVAKEQYEFGYMDAGAVADEVVGGMEIRVVRVISSAFLWLAQVQTLIRLFPRHKEKVIIKWTGFGLIVLDTIFNILNNLVSQATRTSPRSFVDAVPALNYLFELALSFLYAAWVIFYSLSKHRYAFFHTKMKNICLVALLSLVAVLIPIVFFVLDISKPNIAGWGEYIRWVGAAAASVVVWEWVERIEALERDERNDGILGREVFDGDEMLEVTPSEEVDRAEHRRHGGGGGTGITSGWGNIMRLGRRRLRARNTHHNGTREHQMDNMKDLANDAPLNRRPNSPTLPPNAVTPVSRADTTSVASTVYCVRYHPISSPSPPILGNRQMEDDHEKEDSETLTRQSSSRRSVNNQAPVHNMDLSLSAFKRDLPFLSIPNPFKRRRGSPPQEVATAQAEEQVPVVEDEQQKQSHERRGWWDMRPKFDSVLPSHKGKGTKSAEKHGSNSALPVTVIPARGGQQAWSPRGLEDASTHGHSNRNSRRADNGETPVVVIPAKPRSSRAWSTYSVGYSQVPEAGDVQSPGGPSQQVGVSDSEASQHLASDDQHLQPFDETTSPVEDSANPGPSTGAEASIPEAQPLVPPPTSDNSVPTNDRVHFEERDIEAGNHRSR